MRIIKKLLFIQFFIIFSMLTNTAFCAHAKVTPLENPMLLAQAKLLSNYAVIQPPKHGYIYASVSENYIDKLYAILIKGLPEKSKQCLFQDRNSAGAHISLVYSHSKTIEEKVKDLINKRYQFEVTSLYKIEEFRYYNKTFETFYVLKIKAPELTQDFSAIFPNDAVYLNELHITIAISKKDLEQNCILDKHHSRRH